MTASDAGARELEAAKAEFGKTEMLYKHWRGRQVGAVGWNMWSESYLNAAVVYIDALEARLHATERELARARAANDVAAPILSVFKAHQQSWQEAGFGTSSLHDFLFEWADTTWLSENLVALLSTFMREPAANAEPTAPLLAADAPAEGDA